MKALIEKGKTYDVVIIDPPSFAKQQSDIDLAKKKYAQLAVLGQKLTAKNGLLVLASCSSRVLVQSFFDLNSRILNAQHRLFETMLKTQHDVDHPISFPEGAYLKSGYYRFLE
jgi:23S rRNA (cytosine1962-C5)-methyltransferase